MLLPYFATVVLIALVEFFGHNFVPNWINVLNFKHFVIAALYSLGTPAAIPGTHLSIQPIGAIWFLPTMFLGNIVFHFSFKFSRRYAEKESILALLSLIWTILGFFLGTRIQLPWSFDATLISQSFYCFGYLIRKVNLVEKGN